MPKRKRNKNFLKTDLISDTVWEGQKNVTMSQLTPKSPSKVTLREKAVSLDLGILRLIPVSGGQWMLKIE